MQRQLASLSALLIALLPGFSIADDGDTAQTPQAMAASLSQSASATLSNASKIISSLALGACFRRPPPYPDEALRMDQQGRTIVSFEVSSLGIAEKPALGQSSGFPLLDTATLEHLQRCIENTATVTAGQLPKGKYALPMVWRLEYSLSPKR